MGLKSKLSKMKNFLFDEEEAPKPEKKKDKAIKKKEEEKEIDKAQEVEELYFDDISDAPEDEMVVKSRVTKESTFEIPEYNDNDFMTPSEPVVTEEKKTVEIARISEQKTLLYQGSKRREENKRFKPTPIISPIYGLLDESGNEIKKSPAYEESSKPTTSEFDEVRNRAYGKILDEELENTISRLNNKTIEEAEKEAQEAEVEEEDDIILPDVKFKEIDVDKVTKNPSPKESKPVEDDDEDTKEQDLFNLIDTIYSKEGGDE